MPDKPDPLQQLVKVLVNQRNFAMDRLAEVEASLLIERQLREEAEKALSAAIEQ